MPKLDFQPKIAQTFVFLQAFLFTEYILYACFVKIISDYPWWAYLLCIAVGVVFSIALYYRNKRYNYGQRVSIIMSVLRFLSISSIAFLLLSPIFKQKFKNVEKPIIIVAQDNSSSITLNKYADYYKGDYLKQLSKLSDQLSDVYDVQLYTFGNKVERNLNVNYSENQTNISDFISDIQRNYENRNVGAVLLATDGIYNAGASPLNQVEKSLYPIYTLALGDTSVRKDALIAQITFNRIAYLGNQFPIEVTVKANQFKGKQATLNIKKRGKLLFTKEINFTDNSFSTTVNSILQADSVGLQRYQISISHLDGEITYSNNQRDIFIDVLDGRQKVALISQTPHPDVSAIKQSIETNANYEIETYLLEKFDKNLSNYNLLILHQLPSNQPQSIQLIQKALELKIPVLLVLGEQTYLPSLNSLNIGINISTNTNKMNECIASMNKEFPLFLLSDECRKKIEEFPPLIAPFGNYKMSGNSQILAFQKIGNVISNIPLIAFTQLQEIRVGVISGEGIWRWRLTDYALNGNHNSFNEVLNKTIQYLAVKVDKSRFKISCNQVFKETEAIEFRAELYNENYEPVNTPDINIVVYNEKNEKLQYTFNKTSDAYYLNAGIFPVGNYRYASSVNYGGKTLTAKGEFYVEAANMEELNLTADHTMLYTLAKKTDAKMLYPDNMNEFLELLKKREDLKPVTYEQLRFVELFNWPWLFIWILLLLSGEWFLRKYQGGI